MSPITLFEEWERESKEYKRVEESDFCFLDRSNWPKIAEIRSTLNHWFSSLPEEAKSNYKRRFMADHNFNGVFYELFLFTLFRKMGFDVVIEPVLEGNSRRPDFLLTKNEDQFFVEATTKKYSFTSRIPNYPIRQQVIGELDKLDLGDLRLLIYDLKVLVDQTPSINDLKKELIEHCKKIDLSKHPNHSIIDSENERFCYDNKFLFFSTAFYVYMENKTRVKRTVFVDSIDIGVDGIDETIKEVNKSIRSKKTRYGKFERPYIVCVNFPHRYLDQDQIQLLMRPLVMHDYGIYCKSPGLSILENIIDKSISAVFISFVIPNNIADPQFWFIKNPQADFPIGSQSLMLDSYEFENGNFVFKPAPVNIVELMFER